ncbi:peptidylprolyl isomerase [Gluconobacter wancherniae]|uniref:Peptidyl-prolyl cis-trans isomerase n=2 Tax=Gluconobacter wancherniae TaxID=1307955 RepID=A0A511B1Q5_9PROT|nr:peptidylprolyl isomerase [Gluconobacter wancherniae]MBF0854435.1 peptidylprolyl isomerase [Gluconobacter wancherniae]MBS1062830.1 peptidylprolyl isomerase [Gluconobacter wancherniae]MBS1088434.1 peptidylprolyl isomerase [Gluconobacter wancherniae]MBS1094964.1 peptidylprolyl isomerase [Gluconobacter wancherniae]GBD57496.1 peptidyl-prolyl cis-trans isomerase [Gluconobacter wancherniae NBRC 103581]
MSDTAVPEGNKLVFELKDGKVVIELRPDLAPLAVERLKLLASEGFYDGVKFHRVIEGFMAQGGDPTGTGTSGSSYPDLKAEFTKEAKFERGTLGMARTMSPNTANSQFFIMFEDVPSLNGQYTIAGKVIEGMENVDKIKRGAGSSGTVKDPDIIVKAYVEA